MTGVALLFKQFCDSVSINDSEVYCKARYGYPCFGGKKAPFCCALRGNIFCGTHKRFFFATGRHQDKENLIKTVNYSNHKVHDDGRVKNQPDESFKVEYFCF